MDRNEGSWCFGHCYCRRNTPIFALTETLPADPFPMRLRHHQHGHIFRGKFWVQYLLNEPFRLKEHKNNYVQYPRYPKLPELFFWLHSRYSGVLSARRPSPHKLFMVLRLNDPLDEFHKRPQYFEAGHLSTSHNLSLIQDAELECCPASLPV